MGNRKGAAFPSGFRLVFCHPASWSINRLRTEKQSVPVYCPWGTSGRRTPRHGSNSSAASRPDGLLEIHEALA
jgi:hypothetical protein